MLLDGFINNRPSIVCGGGDGGNGPFSWAIRPEPFIVF
jgi:hypothetical protein